MKLAIVKGLAALALFTAVLPVQAQDITQYPVFHIEPLREKGSQHVDLPALSTFSYLPAEGHEKKSMCLLMPTTQDAVFIAYMYGAISEAQRLGQSVTIFDAGGYGHDVNQRAQFENCITSGAAAILLQPINPTGWENDIAEARKAGVKVLNVIEPVDSPVDARVVVDFRVNGKLLGETIAKAHEGKEGPANVVILPGPAGLPFVEDTVAGVQEALKGTDAKILKVMYGDVDAATQLKLVEDALVAFDDIDYIVGAGIAVKQAVNVLAQQGRTDDIQLLATYLDKQLLGYIREGSVMAGAAEGSTQLTAIAMNLAVSAFEGNGKNEDFIPSVVVVNKDNVDDPVIEAANFAPDGWKPEFKSE